MSFRQRQKQPDETPIGIVLFFLQRQYNLVPKTEVSQIDLFQEQKVQGTFYAPGTNLPPQRKELSKAFIQSWKLSITLFFFVFRET